jgi:hypothetical protein
MLENKKNINAFLKSPMLFRCCGAITLAAQAARMRIGDIACRHSSEVLVSVMHTANNAQATSPRQNRIS